MAEIYRGLAYDTAGIKKQVCIKKILPNIAANPEFIDMLIDEAKIAVQLNHGNIAQIYDLGKVGDDYFIVMEYVDGQNLSKIHKKFLRKKEKIPLPIVCMIVSEVANGLNYMHRKTTEEGQILHIIHRDISPQNVMISYSGTAKIIDFGIAKAAFKAGHTESGILKGKFAYMSPEQANGDLVDHRSDIFSLGVILHELITGKRLFKGSDNKETIRNVRRAKVASPSSIDSSIPAEIDRIVLKALTKNPRQRYEQASDLHNDLTKFLHQNYPNFHPREMTSFMEELFGNEMARQRSTEEAEPATPHLILDQTHSAMQVEEEEKTSGGSAGVNWREFMLELDWPEDEPETEEEESEEESVIHEKTQIKWNLEELKKWRGPALLGIGFMIFAALILRFTMPYITSSSSETPRGVESTPPLPSASMRITSEPTGAKIFINDKDSGKKTPAVIEALQAGEYTVGLFLDQYKYAEKTVSLGAGNQEQILIPMISEFGGIKVLSDPPGAEVSINGESAGQTPFEKETWGSGTILKISIAMEGYKTWEQEVKIRAGNIQLISTKLER